MKTSKHAKKFWELLDDGGLATTHIRIFIRMTWAMLLILYCTVYSSGWRGPFCLSCIMYVYVSGWRALAAYHVYLSGWLERYGLSHIFIWITGALLFLSHIFIWMMVALLLLIYIYPNDWACLLLSYIYPDDRACLLLSYIYSDDGA